MKKIVAILGLMLIVSPLNALAFELPNYKKEAKLEGVVLCDQKTTKVEHYQTNQYIISVATIQSGSTFYAYYERSRRVERFFRKTVNSKELVELTHEEWDKVLESESPNFYNAFHIKLSDSSDCEKVETN